MTFADRMAARSIHAVTTQGPPPDRQPCGAEKASLNEDGSLLCDLEQGHLGYHWDPEYGINFATLATDPH